MASFPRNLFPITFKRPRPGHESSYNVDTSQLFSDEKRDSKGRGESNFLVRTWRCCITEPEMNIYRLFYFLFEAAMALFAYLPLYYKQSLLLGHHHVGILMGIRPFFKFLGAPILGSLADKFNRYKSFLYGGLLTYIIVYFSVTFVTGVPRNCGVGRINRTNTTSAVLQVNNTLVNKVKPELFVNEKHEALKRETKLDVYNRNEESGVAEVVQNFDTRDYTSELPVSVHTNRGEFESNNVEFSYGYDNLTAAGRIIDNNWKYPPDIASENSWPLDVYDWKTDESIPTELRKVREQIFMILLLMTITAEFIGAPILSLADTATLQNLKKEPYKYGYQSAWGSLGFGLMSVVFGCILHFTVSVDDEVRSCPEKMVHKYRPVFFVCCFLLFMSLLSTLKFHFREYEGKDASGCLLFGCFKYFANIEYSIFVFLAWFIGLAHGLSISFIYVHLMHIGATPLILLLTSAVQSISKVIFYLLSPTFIVKYGYFPIIYAGLITNALTFFCYSFLESPWMAIPIESLSGISTSCVWAAMVSYIGAPPKIGATLQGVLHAIHTGLGRGIGGLFGGMIIVHYGFAWLFRSFALASLFVFLIVLGFRYWRKKVVQPIWAQFWDYSPITNKEFSEN